MPSVMRSSRAPICRLGGLAAALFCFATPAKAIDEIQVYNAEIAEPGQWTVEQHLNYVANGVQQADHPGGLVPNHSLNGTPEFAYGMTPWWEVGFYAPFALDEFGDFHAQGVKLRTLFVSPEAEKRDFFYGVNFEFSYNSAVFAPTRFGVELRPIVGWRSPDLEFIVNPIVDFAPGQYGSTTLAPAVRLAHSFAKDLAFGFEYYGDYGQIGKGVPLKEQQHALFAVTDFKLGDFDVDFGVGHGFTPGSDRLVFKAIIGYGFPAPKSGEGVPNWLRKLF
ncbi:MAG TPA: hypothetical protein VK446_00975 [Methylocystis sp.]|nr:hypothetical protein [Methylocystis sp.]